MRTIAFTLPEPTPLMNTLMRSHFRKRAKLKRSLAAQIIAALGPDRPAEPFERAHVTIRRFSCGMPDYDGAYGGVKDVLDVMTTPAAREDGTTRNKFGIGLIRDDSPKHIRLTVEPLKCKRAEQRTEIEIVEVTA
ncbi:hypothetical protein [Tanticharoenia sakaeratensis]|uniref:Uncharacterized protein n=1 Tax=Tanticharoenia sakaeratensis NBRC 103193 TaxID=1231623 RepID=A0A0D6MPM7_9PROT|nr:hypothetical protein [Tanticharoenia sakaeratensis]GAN55233.1 hypothetical protein Tasa_041_028 [Tanticharoenia sakaeratensis NBRC 103193]GBQ23311.1 hypothetical protein AA103193_2371 [Tanticharoenia sakaeratensis NBRC 103193]